jgi:hypothetical protein
MLSFAQVVLTHHHYGFLGIGGLIGIFIGLFIFIVIAALLFKIFRLVLSGLGVPAPWPEVLYWLAVLLIFLMFLHFFGLY